MSHHEVQRRRGARRVLWEQALRGIDLLGTRVLDAGTGEGHFARFLAERSPAWLVSISADPHDFRSARTLLGPLAEHVQFRLADVTRMPELQACQFDFVGADYLIAAVAATRPYREIDCLKELERVLRPGGTLLVVGWEMGPIADGRAAHLVRQLFATREAIHQLAGRTPFREHPADWVRERFIELGLERIETVTVDDCHRHFNWFRDNARKAAEPIDEPALRQSLLERLDRLAGQLAAELAGKELRFGRHYGVRARKSAGALIADLGTRRSVGNDEV